MAVTLNVPVVAVLTALPEAPMLPPLEFKVTELPLTIPVPEMSLPAISDAAPPAVTFPVNEIVPAPTVAVIFMAFVELTVTLLSTVMVGLPEPFVETFTVPPFNSKAALSDPELANSIDPPLRLE